MHEKKLRYLRFVFLSTVMMMSSRCAFAQTAASADSLFRKYKFIRPELSSLHNDSIALGPFYKKLDRLKRGDDLHVSVVHIGDSHIQADYFSGTVRKKLQQEFGGAGRGLIFPYKVARTNGPVDYRVSSNKEWKAKRNVFPDQPLPIGICGITIETEDPNAFISIAIKDTEQIDYSSRKLTLFHTKNPESFHWEVVIDSGQHVQHVAPADNGSKFSNSYLFNEPVKSFTLQCVSNSPAQSKDCIFGIYLENGRPGIIYNMIGVNGAMYEHYNKSEYFFGQLSDLKPDLAIVSLGTNESYSKGFDSLTFYHTVDTFVTNLRKFNPGINIILTTPGDCSKKIRSGKKRFYSKNINIPIIRNTLITYCRNNNLAYWDWLEVMGGYGVMDDWFKNKLTDKIHLHLSRQGYILQGELLYKAIVNGYSRNKKNKN